MEQPDRNFIDDMTKMIIRPHRDIYTIEKLGPQQMIVKGKTVANNDRPAFKYVEIMRKDQAVDCKGKKIQFSFFSPAQPDHKRQEHPQDGSKSRRCVVYLHANSGSRVEGLELVKYILPFGWTMAIFDYRGSGLSEGEFTSMGVNESQDLEKILQHLGTQQRINEFCLWGRSMGAVTILYYLTKQYYWNHLHAGITVRAVVLDSPFSNMQKLMYEIGSNKISLPEFVFTPVVNSIIERITVKLGFNLIKELDLLDRVKQLKQKNMDSYRLMGKISALFLTSLQDKLINSSHVQALHQHFPFHPNDLHYFNGQHNDNRSDTLKNKCAQFLCEIPERKEEERPMVTSLKRSELDVKKVASLDEPKKEMQFLLRKDANSPKFKARKEVRIVTQDPNLHQREVRSSKIIEESRQTRVQSQNPTIIINNNYNVSVNLMSSKSTELSQEIIPPINFKGEQFQGYMTDRLNDNPIMHKYFGAYTTKVEKKEHQHPPYSHPFNISSPTNSNYPNHHHPSPFHKHQASKTTTHKEPLLNNPNANKIEIPKIKFQGIDYNIERQEDAREKLSCRDVFERQPFRFDEPRLGPPPQLMQQTAAMYTSQPSKIMQSSEKAKLSLAQLRKIQKQEHQKCVMKTSKVISIKDRQERSSDDFERLHLKSQGNPLEDSKSLKQKPPMQPIQGIERFNAPGTREVRSLKTSLMQKRKVMDRKNSEASQNMKTSYMHQGMRRPQERQIPGSPQKFLEFKVKIQHL